MMKKSIKLISNELEKQRRKGYSVSVDETFNLSFQLSKAAGVLCTHEEDFGCSTLDDIIESQLPVNWDEDKWEKMMRKNYQERLIIAGALIAAELERIGIVSEKEVGDEL